MPNFREVFLTSRQTVRFSPPRHYSAVARPHWDRRPAVGGGNVATPTGGHPYNGDQSVPGEHGDNRFGFPAAPDGQGSGHYQPYQQPQQYAPGGPGAPGSEWPPQQPGAGWPQQQQRYDAPPAAADPAGAAAAGSRARQAGRAQPAGPSVRHDRRPDPTALPARHRGAGQHDGRSVPAARAVARAPADLLLCIEIKSVAEISALLSIPLGVARILVADLAEAGLVAIHQPGGDETMGQPDVTLLERVLSGLRKL